MAETMLSEAVGRMMDLMIEEAKYRVKLVSGAEEEVRSLGEKLTMLNAVLNDAEKRRYKEESVNSWLFRLQQKSYEMEDILDEWDYAILKLRREEHQYESVAPLKQKVRSFLVSSFSCSCFNKLAVRHEIALKIVNVKEQFDKLLKEKEQFSLVMSQPTEYRPPNRSTTSFTDVGEVRGRDSVRDTLVTKLMSNCRTPHVVSVVGTGGLGKTTIAQLVYNHTHVEKHFDLRIWVCVSDPFDMAAIAKGIIESAKKGDSPSTNNLETLSQSVKDCISGKKILLVLDDVWTEEYNNLECLKSYLSCSGKGSKILVTTRKPNVAKKMGAEGEDIIYPDKLSHEDCWLLMRRIAGPGWEERMESGQERRREFEETGKKIAEKCDGLPLAARTLGSLLCTKSTLAEWKGVLINDIWKMKEAEVELFPHLLLSYNELSPSVKRCFSYCGVYPQDYKIDVEDLIRQWTALGYLGSDATGSRVEDRGQEYFEIIAMHSLFQDFKKEYDEPNGKILYCKMHDIVHDFAKFLRKSSRVEAPSTNKCQTCQDLDRDPPQISTVNEFRSFFWDVKVSPPILCDCLTRIRVLSLRYCNLQRIPEIMEKFIHLRWLVLSRNKFSHEELKIIFKLYNLKTLELRNCSLKEIPAEIGNLTRLRYLDLSSNGLKKLPKEIGKLVHLTHLDLSRNKSLTELPMEIGNLTRLRYLDLSSNGLKKLPKEIGKLVHLTHLDLSRNKSLTELPMEIGNLVHLRKLDLHHESLEKLPKEIGKLVHLTHLDLSSNESLTELPRDIGNLVRLRKLDLRWNRSLEKLPETICSLHELRTLNVEGCKILCAVPEGLAKLSSLSSLTKFRGGSTWSKLELLKNLTHLIKDVTLIIRLGGDNDLESAVEVAREAKLRKLVIKFEVEPPCSRKWMDVIDALLRNLQNLTIEKYKGSKLPGWMVLPLNQLWSISLNKCHHLTALPLLGKLPWLKRISIKDMDELEMVGREFLGFTGCSSNAPLVSFPRLTSLVIEGCGKWKEWEDITAEEEASPACAVMPYLTVLRIIRCNGLTALPHRLIRKASCLKRLDISGSTQLEKCYLDMDDADIPQIDRALIYSVNYRVKDERKR